jgi:hypothetical protein
MAGAKGEDEVPLGAWVRTYPALCPSCFGRVEETELGDLTVYTEVWSSEGPPPWLKVLHVCADPKQARDLARFYNVRDHDPGPPEELHPIVLERTSPTTCPFCGEACAEVVTGSLRALARLDRPEVKTRRGRARLTIMHRCASPDAARELERYYERFRDQSL